MKSTIVIFTFLLLLIGSCKKRTKGNMTVIKGCEGTYLRINNKDYSISNEDKLDPFENGTIVEASIIKTKDISNKPHCGLVHDYQTEVGVFKVIKIK